MYMNLEAELNRVNLSKKTVSEGIQMAYPRFCRKLRRGHFSTSEAFQISDFLGGRQDIKYLFAYCSGDANG